MAKPRKVINIIITLAVLGIAISMLAPKLFEGGVGLPGPLGGGPMDYDKAVDRLKTLVAKVDWSENFVRERAKIALGGEADIARALPDIDTFALVVSPPPAPDEVRVELFVSTEKSGTGTDGWMVRVAQDFNAANQRLGDGSLARVAIRKIASGTGYQFIASRKYVPDGFSPSNALWVAMAEGQGVAMTPIRERTVGNVAGVVMKSSVAKRLRETYGKLDVPTLVEAVVQGTLVMGYTNPFASSTGLNFLVTVLQKFSGGDPGKFLSPDVASAFEGFQRGVPFVALTTLQMRESVEKSGSLDAFVMEYQTYAKTASLRSGYEFIPFGIRHDNPLYGVGELSDAKREVLEKFAAFADGRTYTKLAKDFGFNPALKYDSAFATPPGDVLVQAQKLWKEKKDAGRPIVAVFVADVSGSMRGTRLIQLKKALLGGSEFIASGNSIGLVVFNHQVTKVLPVAPFNLSQKAAFHAAVQRMEADGNTAMYDGIAVGLEMLIQEKQKNPDVKPILFVLSDGKTNRGHVFEDLSDIVEGIGIPVYTIGYEADLAELGRVSSLVEAASLNAGEAEIEYKIGTLLNAQM